MAELDRVVFATAASGAEFVEEAEDVAVVWTEEVAEMLRSLAAVTCDVPSMDSWALEPASINARFAWNWLKIPLVITPREEEAKRVMLDPARSALEILILALAWSVVPLRESEAVMLKSPGLESDEPVSNVIVCADRSADAVVYAAETSKSVPVTAATVSAFDRLMALWKVTT
jgi:hypothetical protein